VYLCVCVCLFLPVPLSVRLCRASKWPRYFRMTTVEARQCVSVGDALREIDSRHVIKGPFLLLGGDVVSSLHLSHAIQTHRYKREVSCEYVREGGHICMYLCVCVCVSLCVCLYASVGGERAGAD
jgi:hypothetical protein